MQVTRRCLISGPTQMIDSITQKKSNLLGNKDNSNQIWVLCIYLFVPRSVWNFERLQANDSMHTAFNHQKKLEWNNQFNCNESTSINTKRLIGVFDCKNWRPLQHKTGVQVEKGAIMLNSLTIWTLSTVQFFSTISSKTRDLIQTDFNLLIEGKNQFSKSSIEVIIWKFCFLDIWLYTNSANEIFLS